MLTPSCLFDSHRHVVRGHDTSFLSNREVSLVPVERRRGSAFRNILHCWAAKNGKGSNTTLLARFFKARAQFLLIGSDSPYIHNEHTFYHSRREALARIRRVTEPEVTGSAQE